MEKNELVKTLKAQHRELEAGLLALVSVVSQEMNTRSKAELVLKGLEKFKRELETHLKLEDEIFYNDYFAKKALMGGDAEKDKLFMEQMQVIANKVAEFLERYDTIEEIENGLTRFGVELSMITGVLKSRIETEEEGVYAFYLLM